MTMSDDFMPDIDFTESEVEVDPFNLFGPLFGPALLKLDVPAEPSSIPVHTTEIGDELTLTVIRVDSGGRVSHQIYGVDDSGWSLVAICSLFVDALAEIRLWRRYLAAGGSLQKWLIANPDGCRPDHPMITIESAVAR